MVIVLEILLVVGVVGLAVSYLFRGRREAQRQALTESRVEAYMQTIRREGSNAELLAMSDAELKELLLSSARNLRVQSERKWYLLVGGGVVAFVAAIMVATQEGTRGFGIAILVGALVLYGLNEFIGRRIREPLVEKGIDAERLRVE